MNTVIERNAEGVVKAGDVSCIIPKGESMLAVLGVNPMINCGVYAEDGWIYVNGDRVKKWFRKFEHITIWPPVLKDLVMLERRRSAIKEKVNNYYNNVWQPIFEEMVAAGQAHAIPTHKYQGGKCWWLYTSHVYQGKGYSIGFDWVDEPAKRINHELGQRYYNMERKLHRYYGYAGMFHTILKQAIDEYLRKNFPPEKDGITLKLILNGRIYWYTSYTTQYRPEWKKVAWTEAEIMEITL